MLDDGSTLSRNAELPPRSSLQTWLYVALRADQPLAEPSGHALGGLREVELRRGTRCASVRIDEADGPHLILTLPDPWMSSKHARLLVRGHQLFVEDLSSKNGTFLCGQRIQRELVKNGDVIEVGQTFLVLRNDVLTPAGALPDRGASRLPSPAAELGSLSGTLAHRFQVLSDVAESNISVHVRGETGTGKELVGRALHALSRRAGSFVPVNCGALPKTLIEAELFGYRRGAFTGALEDRAGLVRAANDGTLLLDEVGDLPFEAQAALLRVLQEREVLPLGATRPIAVNVRIVSATHHDLESESAEGRFRSDLLARLSGLCLVLPPLRERREDMGLILRGIIERNPELAGQSLTFCSDAARALMMYHWPRNIRELEYRLRLAVLRAKGEALQAEHLFDHHLEPVGAASPAGALPCSQAPALSTEDSARRGELIELLQAHRGNVTEVAASLGKARMQVQRWMKRYRLNPAQYRA